MERTKQSPRTPSPCPETKHPESPPWDDTASHSNTVNSRKRVAAGGCQSPGKAKRAAWTINKRDISEQTTCWRQQLEQLHCLNRICCPRCGILLLDDPIVAATVEVQSRGRNVFRLFHTKCQKREKGKSLYICLGCGEQSAHSARRLISTSCNCMQESPTHSSTSSLGHKGNPKPRCGAEELLGCKENDWPSASQKYFLREHHQVGDGKRGLVYNSLVDWRRRTGFEGLSDEEVHHHLHITNIHHGITASKSKDVYQLTADLVDEGSRHRKGAENAMRIAFEKTILGVLQWDG